MEHQDPSALTTESLLREIEHLRSEVTMQLDGMRGMLNERYSTQTKALDKAFEAQQEAMTVALANAAAAVTKAETATDKRFESVNEFRAQLADQTASFMNRAEGEVRLSAINDRLDRVDTVTTSQISRAEYAAAHEALRMGSEANRLALVEHRAWDNEQFGKINGALASLKSRYAGVSVALGVVMTVLIIVVTVIGVVTKV
jgi:predicted phage tail protein